MWQKFDQNYYFKFNFNPNYELFITNFVEIWSNSVSKDQFMKLVKQSNVQLETSEDNLLNQVTNMLQDTEGAQCMCECATDNVMDTKIMKKSLEGYPVKLKFKLILGSKQMFFQEVTLSLMNTIKDLTEGQRELFTALRKKDREIESYKLDGATLSLGQLKTPLFNEEEHRSKHSTFAKVFRSSQIPEDIIQKKNENGYIDPIIKEEINGQNTIKEEMYSQNTIKEEPVSQTSMTLPYETTFKREHMVPTTPKKRPRKVLNL